jgi:hypothetical protein
MPARLQNNIRDSSAFREGQQIIIPLAIGMGAHILPIWTIYNANIRTPTPDKGEKGVCACVDGRNHLLSGPAPVSATQIRDALVWVVPRLLFDTSNLNIRHSNHLFSILNRYSARHATREFTHNIIPPTMRSLVNNRGLIAQKTSRSGIEGLLAIIT